MYSLNSLTIYILLGVVFAFILETSNRRLTKMQGENYVKLNGKLNSDILSTVTEINNPGILTDTIINHLFLGIEEKQKVLYCLAQSLHLMK